MYNGKKIEARIVEITPEMAKAWLDATPSQFRTLNLERAKRIADHIRNGKWEFNGETIKINSKGEVTDGQHRLKACVLANIPIRSMVIFGIDDNVHVDTGKHRSASEHLTNQGMTSATTLAALAKLQWLFEKGNLMWTGDRSVASPQEISDIVQRHPGLIEAIKKARKCHSICNVTPLAFAYYQFSQRDQQMADDFIECLASGAQLSARDPVFVLREMLQKNNKRSVKMTTIHKLAYLIKAWNAWRDNKEVYQLSWRRIGKNPEDFPAIF